MKENAFRLLGLPERADLRPEDLQAQFQKLGAQAHPDAAGDTAAFSEIGAAYRLLQSPAQRLRHLLELRFGPPDLQGAVPPEWLDLFARIGPALQHADALLQRRRQAASRLAQALLTEESLACQEDLQGLLAETESRWRDRLAKFSAIDAALEAGLAQARRQAEALCRELVYLERWRDQIGARLHDLF